MKNKQTNRRRRPINHTNDPTTRAYTKDSCHGNAAGEAAAALRTDEKVNRDTASP